MTQKLNPFSGRQFLDANGDPYSGAQLFVYEAGTSTKYTVTKDSAGASNHANPIILNSRGEPGDGAGASQAIWQGDGQAVKLVLAPSGDTDPPVSAISTWDNLEGVNDTVVSGGQAEWITGTTPTYVSATSFTVVGDQSSTYHVGRRLKTTNSGGTVYSTVTAVSYSSVTTVTVINDSSALDAGLTAVSYALLAADNNSLPGGIRHGNVQFVKGSDITSASSLTIPGSGNYFDVTGTTTITGIATVGVGALIKLHFDSALSLTHNGTSFALLGGEDIDVAAGDELEFFEYSVGNWRQTIDTGLPRVALNEGQTVVKQQDNTGYEAWAPKGYISGLIMSNNVTDSEHDIDISVGEATDADGDHVLKLTASTTRQIDAAFGTGNGGLSSSLTVANNTWYHYFIVKTGTGACDIAIDTSITAANLVTDHSITEYRRIGSALTNGSANITAFLATEQTGGGVQFNWDVPLQDFTATGTQTVYAPLGIKTKAIIALTISLSNTSGTSNTYALITDPDTTGATASATVHHALLNTGTGSYNSSGVEVRVYTNTSSQVDVSVVDSGDASSINGLSLGWIDDRV